MKRRWKGLFAVWMAFFLALRTMPAVVTADDAAMRKATVQNAVREGDESGDLSGNQETEDVLAYVYTGTVDVTSEDWDYDYARLQEDMKEISLLLDTPLDGQEAVYGSICIPEGSQLSGWNLWLYSVDSGYVTGELEPAKRDGQVLSQTYYENVPESVIALWIIPVWKEEEPSTEESSSEPEPSSGEESSPGESTEESESWPEESSGEPESSGEESSGEPDSPPEESSGESESSWEESSGEPGTSPEESGGEWESSGEESSRGPETSPEESGGSWESSGEESSGEPETSPEESGGSWESSAEESSQAPEPSVKPSQPESWPEESSGETGTLPDETTGESESSSEDTPGEIRISGSGTYRLKKGDVCSLGEGLWTIEGDITLYRGGRMVWISRDGTYTFHRKQRD